MWSRQLIALLIIIGILSFLLGYVVTDLIR